MNSPTAGFTYRHFRDILHAANAHFEIHPLLEAPLVLGSGNGRHLILRHDVDLDLGAALHMARIEAQAGVRATYMVLPDNPLYVGHALRDALRELRALGHEVGLHFDAGETPARGAAADHTDLISRIERRSAQLADLIGRSVASISFHRPAEGVIGGPLHIAGLVNAYARELMGWYVSDSRGRWRSGLPLQHLQAPGGRRLLQLLIHPIWWGERHLDAEQRLQHFFESATAGMPPAEARSFDRMLAGQLSIRRSGLADALQRAKARRRRVRRRSAVVASPAK